MPTKLYEDNQGAICLANNPTGHKRTKHIDVRHHFIREQIENKTISLAYIKTTEMTADLLTKALPRIAFQRLRGSLGLENMPR